MRSPVDEARIGVDELATAYERALEEIAELRDEIEALAETNAALSAEIIELRNAADE